MNPKAHGQNERQTTRDIPACKKATHRKSWPAMHILSPSQNIGVTATMSGYIRTQMEDTSSELRAAGGDKTGDTNKAEKARADLAASNTRERGGAERAGARKNNPEI